MSYGKCLNVKYIIVYTQVEEQQEAQLEEKGSSHNRYFCILKFLLLYCFLVSVLHISSLPVLQHKEWFLTGPTKK